MVHGGKLYVDISGNPGIVWYWHILNNARDACVQFILCVWCLWCQHDPSNPACNSSLTCLMMRNSYQFDEVPSLDRVIMVSLCFRATCGSIPLLPGTRTWSLTPPYQATPARPTCHPPLPAPVHHLAMFHQRFTGEGGMIEARRSAQRAQRTDQANRRTARSTTPGSCCTTVPCPVPGSQA